MRSLALQVNKSEEEWYKTASNDLTRRPDKLAADKEPQNLNPKWIENRKPVVDEPLSPMRDVPLGSKKKANYRSPRSSADQHDMNYWNTPRKSDEKLHELEREVNFSFPTSSAL